MSISMANHLSPPQPQKEEDTGAGLAQVTFRVKCGKIGHGETLFLSPNDNAGRVRLQFFCVLNFSFIFTFNLHWFLLLRLDPAFHNCQITPMVYHACSHIHTYHDI